MRTLRTLILCAALALPMHAVSLDLSAGVTGISGWFYSWQFSPGYSGTGIHAHAMLSFPSFTMRVGAEASVTGIGTEVMFPLSLGYVFLRSDISAETYAAVIPGWALFRPSPLFMIGGEVGVRSEYLFAGTWGAYLSIALRYMTCPEYVRRVADHQVLDIPISMGVIFRFGDVR